MPSLLQPGGHFTFKDSYPAIMGFAYQQYMARLTLFHAISLRYPRRNRKPFPRLVRRYALAYKKTF